MTTISFPSIRNKIPTEEGGPTAKQGNSFERQIILSYCLEMLFESELKEVWCDLHDDAVLVYDDPSGDVFEFVQIKDENHDQLWTVSLLCEKKKGKKSIYEKSLAHDDCSEPVRFRLVTSLPFKKELAIFSRPIDSDIRKQSSHEIKQLAIEINKKVNNAVSPKGNDAFFWLGNFTWEYRGGERAVKDGNLGFLQKFLEQNGIFLTLQQRIDLYTLLEGEIETAAKYKFKDGLEKKIIRCDEWKRGVLTKARNLEAGVSSSVSDDLLVSKMETAGIDDSFINSAIDLRLGYNWSLRESPYLDAKGRKLRNVARQVLAEMQSLRSKLEAGDLIQDGVKFHQTCIEKLENLKSNIKGDFDIDLAFLQGCMYDITGRCQHHFIRRSGK